MYMHCHALTICQLPSCNLFTQHVRYLYGETPLVNCGPRSNSFKLIKPQTANCSFFIRCNLILIFHTRRLILCFQQAGEIDNLTVSLGQSTLIVLCAGPRWWSCCAVRAANNLLKNRYSYWFDKPWFHTEGKLAARLHQTFLLGSPNEQVRLASSLFLAPLPGSSCSSARGVSHFQSLYFVFAFLSLFYFTLFSFNYQKHKKN